MARRLTVTLKQIARRAGCSVTAVSKSLNNARGTASVGEARRQVVLQIAQELGYTPNYHARSLHTGRASAIGLLLRQKEHNHFWGQLVRGVEQAARAADHDLILISAGKSTDEVSQGLSYLRERRIDALIVPAAIFGTQLHQLDDGLIPVVLIGGPARVSLPTVWVDERPGVAQAIEHLAALGHRELLWVDVAGRTPEPFPQYGRVAALHEAATKAGITIRVLTLPPEAPGTVNHPESLIAHSYREFATHLQKEKPAAAILAYNEQMAIGMAAALSEAGYRIPRDVSLIGFDDIYAPAAVPPLTVVSLCLSEIGARAAELALEITAGHQPMSHYRERLELVPARLVVRRSTAAKGHAG